MSTWKPGDVLTLSLDRRIVTVVGRAMGPSAFHVLDADGTLDQLFSSAPALVSAHPIWSAKVRACVRRDHPDAPPEATTCPTCGLTITPIKETTA